MKIMVSICLLITNLFVVGKMGAQESLLKVRIEPLSDTLGAFELLYVNLKFENKSNKTISCFIPYSTNTVMQIRRVEPEISDWKLCNEFGYNAEIIYPESNGWYLLPPNYKDENWYRIYPCSPDFSTDRVSFLPGRYECRLIYSPSDQYGVWITYPEPCKECITSSFNFIVRDSDNNKAIERLTSIKEGRLSIAHMLYNGNRLQQIPCEDQILFFESFILEFPDSYFTPYIHGALANSLIRCEKKKVLEDPVEMSKMIKRILFHLGKACESNHPWLRKLHGYELRQHEKELFFHNGKYGFR